MNRLASKLFKKCSRRIKRTIRTRFHGGRRSCPRIVHIVYQSPSGYNRGDAVMGLAIPQILKGIRSDLKIVRCEIAELRANASIQDDIGPCDMVVIGGGGLYGKWHALEKLLGLRDLGIPVVLYALGVNINDGDESLPKNKDETIQKLNSFASLSSVRDRFSQFYLERLGAAASVIVDPGALYNPGGLRPTNSGVTHIGINLPHHGFVRQDEILEDVLPKFREVCNSLLRDGATLHYMQHHPDEENVISRLGRIPMTRHHGGVTELVRAYRGLDMMIGGMLHSNIFAVNAGVPFISLPYDKKHAGFLELMERPDASVPLSRFSAGAVLGKIEEIWRNLDAEKQLVSSIRERLRNDHVCFAKRALELLS